MGCVLVVGIATVIGSLLADLLYAVADPRVRYS
jgi:ABC-type dipeptide/oligopeptide/nickel transport system permease component